MKYCGYISFRERKDKKSSKCSEKKLNVQFYAMGVLESYTYLAEQGLIIGWLIG